MKPLLTLVRSEESDQSVLERAQRDPYGELLRAVKISELMLAVLLVGVIWVLVTLSLGFDALLK